MKSLTKFVTCMLVIVLLSSTIPLSCVVGTKEDQQLHKQYMQSKPDPAGFAGRWSFRNVNEWKDYAKSDEDSVELIVGIDKNCPGSVNKLRKMVTEIGAHVAREIKAQNHPVAVVVDIPTEKVEAFSFEVRGAEIAAYVEPNFRVGISMTPNDPYWSNQWGPRKIEADWAWNTTMGNSTVLVAVIDTGIDYTHPDLVNTYVSLGYDWVNNDTDPLDDHGHGTHCAGIIAATTNNNVGIAGVAQVRIMAEKVLDSEGYGYWDWVAQGIYHATNRSAKIISMSLGGSQGSETLQEAATYAHDHGVLLVAAAGNDDSSMKTYPASYDEVIAVAATNQTDGRASFSNWGNWIDLAAPGVQILSTLPTYHVTVNNPPRLMNMSYGYLSGTSMACPHVSGVAALAWSQHPDKPSWWIGEWLRYTADDLGEKGFDIYYGHGRVNAKKAVGSLPEHEIVVLSTTATKFINANESSTVKASIMNFGVQTEQNLNVNLLVNGTPTYSQNISTLEGSAITEVTFVTGSLSEGLYNMTVWVTPVPGETYTSNNADSDRTVVDEIIRVPEPFSTIQEGVDAARPGDTIFVDRGQYFQRTEIRTENITIYGTDNNATAIFDCFLIYSNGIYLHNLNFSFCGCLFYYTRNCTVEKCFFKNGDPATVYIRNGTDNTVRNNVLGGFSYNVILLNSTNTVVKNNYISKSFEGIIIDGYGTNYIQDNQIVDTCYGISLGYYMWMQYADGRNVFRNNTIRGYFASPRVAEGLVVLGTELSHFIHDIDTSNTVNGKPIYYLINQHGLQINPTTHPSVGLLALVNSTSISVENLRVGGAAFGLLFAYVYDSSIRNVTSSALDWGLFFHSANNVSISNSKVYSSWWGIHIQNSRNMKLRNNAISSNVTRAFGVHGLELSHFTHDIDKSNTIRGFPIYYLVNSQQTTIPRNASYLAAISSTGITATKLNISNNEQAILLVNTRYSKIEDSKLYNTGYGIQLIDSYNNTVKGNYLQGDSGIELRRSSNNSVYLNDFMTINGHEKIETNSTNVWHGRWNASGNFWYYYRGNDINKDGIGDTPYNEDLLPIMQPHIPGDVNYDGVVSMTDLYIIQAAYGSYPGHPKWNKHADLNEDGKVDVRDYYAASMNYGKKWTDYWGIPLVPVAILAKDLYNSPVPGIEVWIDGIKVGYANATYNVTPYVRHDVSVSSNYTKVVPGDGTYFYTFLWFEFFGDYITDNPMTFIVVGEATINAYYNWTYTPRP